MLLSQSLCQAPAQAAPDKETEAEPVLGSNASQSRQGQSNHRPCLCPEPACAPSPQGQPCASIAPRPRSPEPPSAVPAVPGPELSAHRVSRAVLEGRGALSPRGSETAPGRGGGEQRPPVPPQGRWVTMLRRATLGRKPHLSLFCLSIRVRSLTLSTTKIKLHFSQPGEGQPGSPSPGPCGSSPHQPRGATAPARTPPLPGFMETFILEKKTTFPPLDPAPQLSGRASSFGKPKGFARMRWEQQGFYI